MDPKSKGIAWVGNIYRKFETMCLEVDNMVKQDSVNYVENQVQTVGKSVKKFYSDVFNDLLPPVDPGKHADQAVTCKGDAAIDTYFKSIKDAEENPMDSVTKPAPVKPNVVDPVENQEGLASSGIHLVNHLIAPSSADLLEDADPELSSGNIDLLTNKYSNMSSQSNAVMEKSCPSEALELASSGWESFGSLFSDSVDGDLENACGVILEAFPEATLNDTVVQSLPLQKLGIICDNSADEPACVSEASITLTSREMDFSAVPCDKKMELASSSSSPLVESLSLSENSSDLAKPVLNNHCGNLSGCVSDRSNLLPPSTLAPTLSCNDKPVDMASASLSCSPLSESIGTSDDWGDDVIDSNMETIDLSDKVKLEESCVLVNGSPHFSFSDVPRKHRSYKKTIRAAFTSKKRLAKEYEQLAILYGDIDADFSPEISLTPSVTTTMDLNNLQARRVHDSEWELL